MIFRMDWKRYVFALAEIFAINNVDMLPHALLTALAKTEVCNVAAPAFPIPVNRYHLKIDNVRPEVLYYTILY